jgi:acyl-CoA synthetase (AMP-forming)/AMP-acid ligase II
MERCTALHGVPAMFSAQMELLREKEMDLSSLRTGIAAGSAVPRQLLEDLHRTLNLLEITNTYGSLITVPLWNRNTNGWH